MLDTLIESKSAANENRRLGGFLLSTVSGAATLLTFALVYSLFNYNLALGENLDLSSIAAPVAIAENAPPPDAATAAPKPAQASIEKSISKLPTRRENIMRVDEMPNAAPDTISTARSTSASRPNGRFTLDSNDSDLSVSGAYTNERGTGTGAEKGVGISDSFEPRVEETEKNNVVPPPIIKTAAPKTIDVPKKIVTVSTGVVNGKAINLVKPEYSKAAQAIRAGGEVKVQVTIDEDGNVVSASAVSGHPLLRSSAVNAARGSKFSPTLLSNQKVRVTGLIVYNFKQ